MRTAFLLTSAAALAGAVMATPALACSTCSCSLNSDWSTQGYAPGSGVRVDLRYDYFDQTQLRSGTSAVDRGSYPLGPDQASEIQQETRNRVANLGIDYAPTADWGVSLLVPVIDRYHTTVAPGDTQTSTSQSSGLGDIRLLARYQGFSAAHGSGVLFGLKLPTGEVHDRFSLGPSAAQAPPENALDRGLQLGTGTTDLLLGGYTFGAASHDWDYFVQGFVQLPLNSYEQFRPGKSVNINGGLRYMALGDLKPQIQLNLRVEGRESGEQADIPNSGSTLTYIAPGLSYSLNSRLDIYGFASIPVYQRVNGLQLEQRYSLSLGVHYAL